MTYHTLGKYLGPTNEEIRTAMSVRDLMSATLSLSELPGDELAKEIDDIELAHARLSKIIQRVCNGEHDSVRELRFRSHGHQEAASGTLAVREVSQT